MNDRDKMPDMAKGMLEGAKQTVTIDRCDLWYFERVCEAQGLAVRIKSRLRDKYIMIADLSRMRLVRA